MEKIISFDQISSTISEHGNPKLMYINAKDNDILESTFPVSYHKAELKEFWSHGKLGYLFDVPVLSTVIGKKKTKLVWE